MEGADHVLAQGMIDAGLAADRGVDLREKRGRHLDERDAPQENRSGESGEIAHHAATQCDDRRLAVAARFEQGVENEVQGRAVLERFPIGHDDRQCFNRLGVQRFPHAGEIQRRDGGVGDDGDPCMREMGNDQLGAIEQSLADVNRIAALAEADRYGVHRAGGRAGQAGSRGSDWRSRCSSWPTRLRTLWLPVSMVTSATSR